MENDPERIKTAGSFQTPFGEESGIQKRKKRGDDFFEPGGEYKLVSRR